MDKKEEFKVFARNHPELINYMKEHQDTTWQQLYEIYDIYGPDERSWSPYFTKSNTNDSLKDLTNVFKNLDSDKIQGHIANAQKALAFFQELAAKGGEKVTSIKGPTNPRPITKFFGD